MTSPSPRRLTVAESSSHGVAVQVQGASHPLASRLTCDVYSTFPSNWARISSLAAIGTNTWHFAVLLRDSGTVTLYLDGAQQSSANVSGAGCPGGFGTPTLTAPIPPRLGTLFEVDATNLDSAAGFAFMSTGLRGTSSSFGPLPIALQPFGLGAMCELWSSSDVATLFGISGGTGTYSLAIPASQSFAGLPLFWQATSIDPTATGGAAVSNAIAAIVGL